MKTIYADCFSGVSGDMLLGALIGLGIDRTQLLKELSKIDIEPYSLEVEQVPKGAIWCTQCKIIPQTTQNAPRGLKEIEKLIEKAIFPNHIKETALEIFRDLAKIEAKIHNTKISEIHFHELGAVDTIIDIMGVIIAIGQLEIDNFLTSPLQLGRGIINTQHGPIPIPAPATLEILKDIPVIFSNTNAELVTPTGAILIKHLTNAFGVSPKIKIKRIAYGAGDRDLNDRPNCLRLVLGESAEGLQEEEIEIIECNIDDMNPEFYPYLMNMLYKAGALDVSLTQIIMKKGRPGIKVTVMCSAVLIQPILQILITETTTIGVRKHRVQRYKAVRKIKKIQTKYGPVNIKYAIMDNQINNISPEYEDCFKISRKYNRPLKAIYQEILTEASKEDVVEKLNI